MGRFKFYVALAAVALAAGCAAAPERAAENGVAGEPAQEAAGAATTTARGAAVADTVTPSLAIDAIDPAPESRVTCREMLKQGSNVIITQCMTLADWKRFERRQARDAQEIVRMLQGGAYR